MYYIENRSVLYIIVFYAWGHSLNVRSDCNAINNRSFLPYACYSHTRKTTSHNVSYFYYKLSLYFFDIIKENLTAKAKAHGIIYCTLMT